MGVYWICYAVFMIIRAYFRYIEGNYVAACVSCGFAGAGIALFIVEIIKLIVEIKNIK